MVTQTNPWRFCSHQAEKDGERKGKAALGWRTDGRAAGTHLSPQSQSGGAGPRAVQGGELFHGARGQVTCPAARRSFAPPRPVPQLPRTDEASPHRHTYDTPGKEASTPPPALPSVPLASGDPVAAGPSPSRRAPLPLQFPPFSPCFRCRPGSTSILGTHATTRGRESEEQQARSSAVL